MWAGVGKSGSPTPKSTTFSPRALSSFARAVMARVADSTMASRRCETPLSHAASSLPVPERIG